MLLWNSRGLEKAWIYPGFWEIPGKQTENMEQKLQSQLDLCSELEFPFGIRIFGIFPMDIWDAVPSLPKSFNNSLPKISFLTVFIPFCKFILGIFSLSRKTKFPSPFPAVFSKFSSFCKLRQVDPCYFWESNTGSPKLSKNGNFVIFPLGFLYFSQECSFFPGIFFLIQVTLGKQNPSGFFLPFSPNFML